MVWVQLTSVFAWRPLKELTGGINYNSAPTVMFLRQAAAQVYMWIDVADR
jgi:hypothetical protein